VDVLELSLAFADNSTGLVFQRNIVAYRDPEARLVGGGRLRDDRHPHRPQPLLSRRQGALGTGGWDQFLDRMAEAGFRRNSILAETRFIDPAHDNFTLRPDSRALRLGFQPIDTSQVGPRRARCSCKIRPAAPDFGL
jgi:hypothetical protein